MSCGDDGRAEDALAARLSRAIRSERLARPAPRWYARKIALCAALWMGVMFAIFVWRDSPWAALTLALALASIQGQFGLLAHDAGHGHMSHSRAWNRAAGLLIGNVGIGLSFAWWCDKHNRHHRSPNLLGADPDLDVWVHAYSPEQVPYRWGVRRFLIRWQAYLLPLALLFEALSLRWDSAVFLAQSKRVPVRWVEITLFALHHVMHLGAFLVAFGSREGLAVYACKEAALGTYLGLMFLPNHIGCPVLDGTRRIGRLRRQVETARNLLPHLAARVVFGPLVHQIEHHAFPSVPLPRLPRVRELLRPCCDEAGIAYREMGMGAAYREVFAGLQRVAKTGTSSARAAPTR